MYTNIDPTEGIEIIRKLVRYFANDYFPTSVYSVMINLLNLVMRNYIFKFGDTYWVQKIGTAMYNPVACIYAILFFGYYERTKILQKIKKNLLFYKRKIDNVLGIWINDPDNPSS